MLVMITGASSGLGYELSKEFQKAGHTLIMIARKKSLQNIKDEFKNQKLITIDLLQDNIQKKIKDNFADIMPDLIIHCAGSKLQDDKHPIDREILNKSMNINLNNPIEINNYFFQKAKTKSQHLRIIHIGSDAGLTGKASPSYSIAKGALNTYVKNTGRIYAKDNTMLCCMICSVFEHANSSKTSKIASETTLGRFADVTEVAEIIKNIGESKNMLYSAELISITAGNI